MRELDWLGSKHEDSYSRLGEHTFRSSRVRAGTDCGTRGPASEPTLLGDSFAWLRILTYINGKEEVLTEVNPENCSTR